MEQGGKRLGEILIDAELITKEQLKEALMLQNKEYKPLGEILLSLNYLTELQLYKSLEYFFQVPYVDLLEISPETEALALASDKIVRQLDGATPRKVIVVPDRLVNIVA